MDPITSEPAGFQQTQATRVKDPGAAQDANPPPPPKVVDRPAPDTRSPYSFRGQNLNTVA